MDKVLLHCCCAPCSVSCVEPLRDEGIEPIAFWYNPNIHPFKEYEARRDCLIERGKNINMQVIVYENYGLREFVRNVADDIERRCRYCYEHRLKATAEFAAKNGYTHFSTTLLASIYQDHEAIIAAAERYAKEYNVEFLYRDFRPNFRQGNQKARDNGMYMQKYCGCIFSEEDRYSKQIERDKQKFAF